MPLVNLRGMSDMASVQSNPEPWMKTLRFATQYANVLAFFTSLQGLEASIRREGDAMKKTALVVEDETNIADLIAEILGSDGFSVTKVRTIAEARSVLARFTPDLALVDLGLPDGQGLALIQEDMSRLRCGVIVVTGAAEETDMVLGLELGADDYVAKPFRPRALMARVHAVMRRLTGPPSQNSASTPGRGVSLGSISLCEKTRRLFDAYGKPVTLTTAEYNLISILVRHRGQPVTREQLHKELYGATHYGNPRAIDGLISRLRKKLLEHGEEPSLIRTLHRRGYMLVG